MPELTPNSLTSPTPTKLELPEDKFDLAKFRDTKDGKRLVDFVKSGYEQAKHARATKQLQWFQNMSMFFGNQYAERLRTVTSSGYDNKLVTPKKPYYKDRKTINRTRSFVRAEHSKFLSSIPNAIVVPSTAEDQDVRSAYAGEQAWQSISDTKKLRSHYTRAMWWTILTGNGFLKTWWDQSVAVDRDQNVFGDIRFGSITPFHLFVPDLREQEIEDQPFVINAYTKTVEWCNRFYAEELKGIDLQASISSANSILEEGYLNLTSTGKSPDSVLVYEAWIKPGAINLLPDGGVVIIIDTTIVGISLDGLPYAHGQYPFTKFEHIPTSTFYADSPLVDTNQLQREYNQLRSEISEAGRRMARPQLLAQKGSIVASKLTNEPGLVIEYRQGFQPPTPMALAPLPQYYVEQQDRLLTDWEDITGQHDVSRGQAPPGVTAGTAINYLQEKDDQFLTPQYQSIEDGYEKIAGQSLMLFNQYVDLPRKLKVIGQDGAFDTVLLSGADIKEGTDVRIQRGSSIGQSQAAKEAKVMDMFQMGLIDQPIALKLLEVGGAQKVLDTLNVAERKAQRENTKMKMLTPEMLMEHQQMAALEASMAPVDPMAPPAAPKPIVLVDDFDIHEVHIDTHDKFRMSQEYEALPDEVKAQFAAHVQMHMEFLLSTQLAAINSGEAMPDEGSPIAGSDTSESEQGPGATMAANGAVPDASALTQGA